MRASTPMLIAILLLSLLAQAYGIFWVSTSQQDKTKQATPKIEKQTANKYIKTQPRQTIQKWGKTKRTSPTIKYKEQKTDTRTTSIRAISGTPPPASGNWTINDVTVVEGETLIINGSIIVNTSGALILKNTTIYMNLTANGEHWIDVYGNLTMIDSTITAYNTSNKYFIRAFNGSKIRIEDSEISYAGPEFGTNGNHSGLWINTENATIIGTYIHHNWHGIYIYKGNNTLISSCRIDNNTYTGIITNHAFNITIEHTNITNHGNYGIYLYYSNNCTIRRSTIDKTASYSIKLHHSNYSNIYGNIIQNGNNYAIYLYEYCNNNSISQNIIQNISGAAIRAFDYSSSNNIHDNIIQNVGEGIHLECYSSNSKIYGNTIRNTSIYDGISLVYRCYNNDVYNNTIQSCRYGILLNDVAGNQVHSNVIQNSRVDGIYIVSSGARNNYIYNNTIQNSGENGICFKYSASNNIVYRNIIQNSSQWGVAAFSAGNIIYFNDITDPPHDESGGNIYDNGTYGNYWGIKGPDQNRDWIIDTPYIINTTTGIKDNKPLLYPIEAFLYPEEDFDDDYLNNGEERNYGTNPYSVDSDSDDLSDSSEVRIYFTDPLVNDTDFDGMPDGWEARYDLNPLNSSDATLDYDGDGLSNLQEYNYGTNPNIADTDSDSIPDGWEVAHGLDPLNSSDANIDSDNDSLLNNEEYSHGTDPQNADTDGDGMPDGWEVAYDLDPLQDDSSADIDGDGLSNIEEYQHSTNPRDADSDSDGMSDGWEVLYGFDPVDSGDGSIDVDGDGLANCDEFRYGTDPYSNDTDGDGFDDGFEVRSGTNPTDPNDYPSPFVVTETETEMSVVVSNVTHTSVVVRTVVESLPIYALTIVCVVALLGLMVTLLRRKGAPSK